MKNFYFYIGSLILLTTIFTTLVVGYSYSTESSDNETFHERMNENTTRFVQKTLVCDEMNTAMDFISKEMGQHPLFRWTDVNSGTTYMIVFNTNNGQFTLLSNPTNVDANIVCWESQGNNMFVYTDHFKSFVAKYAKYMFGTKT
tara:strand:- start:4097 stop:4528 length:432 start_codon:yes stop_codon:yes gene_type:complete